MTADDNDLAEYVQSLEQRGDAEVDMNDALGKSDGDALAAEFERYLRGRRPVLMVPRCLVAPRQRPGPRVPRLGLPSPWRRRPASYRLPPRRLSQTVITALLVASGAAYAPPASATTLITPSRGRSEPAPNVQSRFCSVVKARTNQDSSVAPRRTRIAGDR